MTRITTVICINLTLFFLTAEVCANSTTPSRPVQKRMDITVRQLTPLAFGTFASSGSGGTITIDSIGGRSILGNISGLSGGDYGPAEFAIAGQPGEEITISPPASAVLGKAGIGGDMVITDFRISPAEILTLDRQGTAKVKIGGVLRMSGAISQGTYNGLFNITARYLH
jgi:hypothetical protein